MPTLGLNEALLVINNRDNFTTELLHQVEECFGCPLVPLKAIGDEANKYVVDTKYNVQLELHQVYFNATGSSCRLNNLALNSQGQYRIDVGRSQSDGGQLECNLTTLDHGECLLCPFAILVAFLFAILALEQAYAKFWLKPQAGRVSGRKQSSDRHVDEDESGRREEMRIPEEGEQEQEMDRSSSLRRHSTKDQSQLQTNSKTMVTFDAPASPAQPAGPETPPSGQRIECLDVFRGLTLAGMIFVNYGGAGYAIWDHKPWDGMTLADLVFPFFIFSMGASIAMSITSLIKRQSKSFQSVTMKILSRSAILMLLGVFLNSKALNYEQPDALTGLRLTGVLQRFSISYLVIALMYTIELTLNKWTRAQSLSNVPYVSKFIGVVFELLTALNYTVIYIYLTFYFDYNSANNCPPGYTGPGGQTAGSQYAACTGGSASWLDRLILGENHLYNDHEVKQIFKTKVAHDPEGILGCTTSIVLALIGLQCGKILISKRTSRQKLISLARWVFVLALSCPLVLVIPVNKRLWSLTFVLVSALAAFAIIIVFYALIDIYSCKRAFLIRLLSSAGKNSIFLYVAHSLIHGMLPWWLPVADPASHMHLLFRLTWSTLVWLLIAHYMAYKKLFIKI